jgi:hypothetical protein
MHLFGNAQILPYSRRRDVTAAVLGVLLALALTACEATGPAGDPVSRSFTWFDYLGGGDLRRACGPGAASRWRIVYNATWAEQVRTYDVTLGPAPAVEAHVFSGGVDLVYRGGRLFPSWFGRGARHELTDREAADLRRALSADVPEPASVGSFLRSDDYYLAASRCVGGRFAFAAWTMAQADLARLPFLPALLAFDHTGQPVEPPRRLTLGPLDPNRDQRRGGPPVFQVQVAADGVNR